MLVVRETQRHTNIPYTTLFRSVTDNENPVVNVPANIAVNNDTSACNASVTFAATPTDNCGVDSMVYKEGRKSTTRHPSYVSTTHTVHVSETDIHRNSASISFTV